MKMRLVVSSCLFVLVTACGSGGGGGSGGGSANTAPVNNKPTAELAVNAGADITVNAGERVDIDPNIVVPNIGTTITSGKGITLTTSSISGFNLAGKSTNNDDIVNLKWSLIKGPEFDIIRNDVNSGKFWFTAPSTDAAENLEIEFRLDVKNAAGIAATDSIKIIVKRVNKTPAANAGVDQKVLDGAQVSLTSSGSKDEDGSIASFVWSQIQGDAVVLSDTSKSDLTFTAPASNVVKEYEFQLTVTDNSGATASDKVKIVVTPKNIPVVDIYFPTPVGVYQESTLSIVGFAKAAEDAKVEKIEVDLDGKPIEATFSKNEWRIDNVTVPKDVDVVNVNVKVTDSLGRIATDKASFKTKGSQGTGDNWMSAYGIGVDNKTDRLLVYGAFGTTINAQKLVAVDLLTGNRDKTISSFTNSAQGDFLFDVLSSYYDKTTQNFYVTTEENTGLKSIPQVVVINANTGNRRLLSDAYHGAGIKFINPVGIVSNAKDTLYIADNDADAIIAVDIATGNRTEIANKNTKTESVGSPAALAVDTTDPNTLYFLPYADTSYALKINTAVKPASSSIVMPAKDPLSAATITKATKIEVDAALGKAFLLELSGNLYEVTMSSGVRVKLNDIAAQSMAYDQERHLLYFNEKSKNAIWVVDVVSGHKMLVSGVL